MLSGETRLEPLKTLHEARASAEFGDVWVIEIPTQLANTASSFLKPLICSLTGLPTLHHLRRLVTKPHLPPSFCRKYDIATEKNGTIFLLFVGSHLVSEDSIKAVLRPQIQHREDLPKLFTTTVPLLSPHTVEQAQILSETYWPCVYNPASRTIQQAPPLHLLRATHAELATPRLETYFMLAKLTGKLSSATGVGRDVGALIVDPVKNEVIAAAGDARWWTCGVSDGEDQPPKETEGRPEQHALMRAVAMIAQKGLRPRTTPNSGRSHELNGLPLNPIELRYFVAPERRPSDGTGRSCAPSAQTCTRPDPYLCNGFDIYLTHEPCACCSMAMIHSRFRACIFMTSMPGTGGLSTGAQDGSLGYGLFWRKELNWRVITFQYRDEGLESASEGPDSEIFHA